MLYAKSFFLTYFFFFTVNLLLSQSFSFTSFFEDYPELKRIVDNNKYQTQIIYTQINRDVNNHPAFKHFTYQLDSSVYFYPASTVKMPTAFLALQRLNELGIPKSTSLKIGADRFLQSAVSIDSTAVDNMPSIENYIENIFLLSDNDAYNRLYEFLGQDYINTVLKEKGFYDSRIKHRLVGGYDGIENEYINPLWFYNKDTILFERLGERSTYKFMPLDKKMTKRGMGYYSDDKQKVIYDTFDFSNKNSVGLQDLHDLLLRIVFPNEFATQDQFQLNAADYQFLYKSMSQLPRDKGYALPDNYVKFLLIGDEKADYTLSPDIKIFNKVGFAYGFVTDVAYIVDRQNGIEFLLSAQLLTNENNIFNDGVYEYEKIAFPFLGKLGKAIYKEEFKRQKQYKPNLNHLFYETDHSSF